MAIPRASVGAVRLDAQKELGDQGVENRSAHSPIDAAESLDLVGRQPQARHLDVLGANTFTNFIDRSHVFIVIAAARKANGHFCTRAHRSDQRTHQSFVRPRVGDRFAASSAQVASLIASFVLFAVGPGCAGPRAPLDVAVTFATSWRIAGETLAVDDRAAIKQSALETLRAAYDGFDVRFDEVDAAQLPAAARIVRVEDTPYNRLLFGAAGVTYPASRVSSVRLDVLMNEELASAGCASLARCAKPRAEILEGLGRGIGATAAHELGHQRGLEFARDSACDDCYDGKSSASYAHFFGRKHWSDEALAIMRAVLPRRRAAFPARVYNVAQVRIP